MLRATRPPKTLIMFTSEKTRRDLAMLDKLTDHLSVLYHTRIENESTIYTAITQESANKIILIYINEISLGYSQFRQCLLTCIAAKLSIILVIDASLSVNKILHFFPYISQSRCEKLKACLTLGLFINNDDNLVLKIHEKIKTLSAVVKHQTYTDLNKRSALAVSSELQRCLQNKKLSLVKPVKKYKIYSYNMLRSDTVLRNKKQNNIMSIVRTHPTDSIAKQKVTELPPIEVIEQKKVSTFKEIKQIEIGEEIQQNSSEGNREVNKDEDDDDEKLLKDAIANQPQRKSICPTIEISDEDEFAVDINEDNKNVPWGERRISLTVNGDSSYAATASQMRKRLSFDYISRTYAVFNPDNKKGNNLLYIDFPYGTTLLRRDSDISLLRSNTSSRRNSFLLTSLGSSSEDLNLECVHEPFFESPIPSPNSLKQCIYQNPLPIFSEEICFPPVGLFPCDSLQTRRPSVFDVLLNL